MLLVSLLFHWLFLQQWYFSVRSFSIARILSEQTVWTEHEQEEVSDWWNKTLKYHSDKALKAEQPGCCYLYDKFKGTTENVYHISFHCTYNKCVATYCYSSFSTKIQIQLLFIVIVVISCFNTKQAENTLRLEAGCEVNICMLHLCKNLPGIFEVLWKLSESHDTYVCRSNLRSSFPEL